MKYFAIFVLLSIILLSGTLVQSASSQAMCVGADEAFHFWVNDIAFIGTVSEINPSNNTDRYDYITFDIKYPLKGLGSVSDFTVATYQGESYSYDFKIDSEYLVHASERKGVKYFTDLCSANQLLKTDVEIEQMKKKISEVQSIPPLKLKQYGIQTHEIKCKDDLVLIQKYDSSPATCNDFMGKPDGECFVKSFEECKHASIKNKANTFEGDPVFVYAYVDVDDCKIYHSVDLRPDRFSSTFDRTFHSYACTSVQSSEYALTFQCDDTQQILTLR